MRTSVFTLPPDDSDPTSLNDLWAITTSIFKNATTIKMNTNKLDLQFIFCPWKLIQCTELIDILKLIFRFELKIELFGNVRYLLLIVDCDGDSIDWFEKKVFAFWICKKMFEKKKKNSIFKLNWNSSWNDLKLLSLLMP